MARHRITLFTAGLLAAAAAALTFPQSTSADAAPPAEIVRAAAVVAQTNPLLDVPASIRRRSAGG